MTASALSCPKCHDNMVRGYIMDHSYSQTLISLWVEGPPKPHQFLGISFSGNFIKEPKAEELIPIGTFRCQGCGYLESYANKEFAVHPAT